MDQHFTAQLEAAQRHFDAGQLDAAAQWLQEVIDADPQHGDALEGLAYIAARKQSPAAAAGYFDRALAVLPAQAERCHAAGLVHQAAGNHARAVALLEQAIGLAPRQLPSLHAAAMSLSALGEHGRALEMLKRAAALSPGSWEIHYNMGRALGLLDQYDAEMAAYRRAIELKPDCADAYTNLGVALGESHRFEEALRMFKKAIQIAPNNPGARANRAGTNLLLGEFEHGWREYECRWQIGIQRPHGLGDNLWLGAPPLAGKTLLLHCEQGFGDTLQFVRYIPLLADTGARIVLRVQEPLRALLADFPGVSAVIGQSEAVPAFDYHCPLLSLPYALWKVSTAIPAATPYLHADAARRARWAAWLGEDTRRPRVGVVWSGSPTHLNDRKRSIPLRDLAPLFEADATFVSLQKDVRASDLDALPALPAMRDPSAQLETFWDTAALIAELDLVICVDTAVAHLAGALGKPVWILVPFTPDWRWQLARTDSPWYPTARLFRQPARDDWRTAIMAVSTALQDFTCTI
ncbi:tetratricopeptide repeat protein [Cupriavidus basilensis]